MLPGHSKATAVTCDIIDGKAIFEGDIMLGEVDAQGHLLVDTSDFTAQSVAISGNEYRWPLGVVPYVISKV